MSVDHLRQAPLALPRGPARSWRHWLGLLTAACDGVLVVALVYAMDWSTDLAMQGSFQVDERTPELAGTLAALFVFVNLMRGRYQIGNYLSTKGQVAAAFSAWNIAFVAFLVLLVLAKIADHYSRAVLLTSYLAGIPAIVLTRSAIVRLISAGSRTGRITSERVFLIGREKEVMSFVDRCKPWNAGSAIVDVAFLNPQQPRRDPREALAADLAAAAASCRAKRPDAVFIAVPWSDHETIEACVDAFMNMPVAIHLAPEKIMSRFEQPHFVSAGALSSLRLTRAPLSPVEIACKRAFDLTAAALAGLLLLPLLLLIALAIRLDSPGPVLFRQRRHGFNQAAFRIFKFRTMTTTDDGAVIVQARRDDPRITRIGRVLRRYNLDELPQLLNVMAGHMSLVGPRPHALAHDREFERKIALYARRHNVKPGITGWAQVNGLRGETDTDEKMAARVAHDLWYIDHWSFTLDLAILFRTVFSSKAFRNAV
ncbi:undecaprenyl-phosphate glucose phosphotransferase [Bosea sp. SSUT16]|uniref:Undecaprenyl-phosphate glucose phosphotransferase n=1 Tax=Bosea spartocytisi TaxID=2773451 RepID=A0A927ECJ8_9HYPH|nr:undecaprenyl-phosphate glucose phosphotransferase [Bosea spartocytisi]MBD3848408.1 undecaprenyl-phosphate glucose phosphotransferase [Bosea spartocytisi]MCT4472757.1 undecaprenyl-phosphate glucose phosphotransferase [Bosea spartocytisi]